MLLVMFATIRWKTLCTPYGGVNWSKKFGGKIKLADLT